MAAKVLTKYFHPTTYAPPIAVVLLAFTWSMKDIGVVLIVVVAIALMAAVLAAVHHAEVVAHRVGEPYGSLVLAVAVTIIEVALIVTLMVSGKGDVSTLARDTVFAAVMITVNGIAGIAILAASIRHRTAIFNAEGAGSALATVITLATLTMVLPTFTTSESGGEFSTAQLIFVAVTSLTLYCMFVATQAGRHRDFFLPVMEDGRVANDEDHDGHADPPSNRTALISLGLLLVSLVAVVGLAKLESPAIEAGVEALGFPHAVVGVIIALLVLLPESIAAVRAALQDRTQVALNLAYGSAMASIGLTIPTIAIASYWLEGPLHLGLNMTEIVLLAMSVVVSMLTIVPGRATRLQGGVHLVLLAAFVFMVIQP